MTPNQSHIAGLELALQQWNNGGPAAHFAAQLRGLIEQAKSSPEPVQGEAVHWRALLRIDQRPAMLYDKHVVGFTSLQAAESWVAEQKDFKGWDYAIEALYTAAARPNAELLKLLQRCQEKLDPHRDAVLWGDVCDALSSQRVKP